MGVLEESPKEGKVCHHPALPGIPVLWSAHAEEQIGSSMSSVPECKQLKRMTPVMSKKGWELDRFFGGPMNNKGKTRTIHWAVAQRPCLETAVSGTGVQGCRYAKIAKNGHSNEDVLRNTVVSRTEG